MFITNINRLVFVIVSDCVLCDLGTSSIGTATLMGYGLLNYL